MNRAYAEQAALDERFEFLVKKAEGKECRKCGDLVRVAFLEGDYQLRCGCKDDAGSPAPPMLWRKERHD